MKLTREVKFGAWTLAAIVIAAASYFIGASLKPAEDPYYIFETDAAAYGEPVAVAATSPGGFTGFGEVDGSNTHTVLAGRVVEIGNGSITLESAAGQQTSLRFGDTPNVTRLVSSSRDALQPGATVSVRLNEDGQTVEAVLVTP